MIVNIFREILLQLLPDLRASASPALVTRETSVEALELLTSLSTTSAPCVGTRRRAIHRYSMVTGLWDGLVEERIVSIRTLISKLYF